MNYLLLILSLVAAIGTAVAQTPPKDTDSKGKECCSSCCCCKK
jgi:hypothetical protein